MFFVCAEIAVGMPLIKKRFFLRKAPYFYHEKEISNIQICDKIYKSFQYSVD